MTAEILFVQSSRDRCPLIDLTAGIVVAAPSSTSARPIARRRRGGILLESRRPAPKPSAALVATMKPNTGSRTVRLFLIAHLCSSSRPPQGGLYVGAARDTPTTAAAITVDTRARY